ncbi:MAG: tyrosine-type recombinase/integrase [Lachnospiraceae bacterium]|nr:tyrosine-type recombinase/integrase [Lachnospiraceae bacterium]
MRTYDGSENPIVRSICNTPHKPVGRAVCGLALETALPDSVYPHMLRRSRAAGLYRDGVPLEMVSAILGHSNSEVTKTYAIPSHRLTRCVTPWRKDSLSRAAGN